MVIERGSVSRNLSFRCSGDREQRRRRVDVPRPEQVEEFDSGIWRIEFAGERPNSDGPRDEFRR